MTQKELNKLYKVIVTEFEDDFDEAIEAYYDKIRKFGAECIQCDWKEGSGSGFVEYLGKHKFVVLEDPNLDGTDTYGWVIFPPKKK